MNPEHLSHPASHDQPAQHTGNHLSQHLPRHLTDDQIDDLLLGDAGPSLQAHLDACPSCNTRFTEFRSTLGLFNQASLSWSEAKSNTLSRDLSTHRVSFGLPSWPFALAMLCLVALALSIALPRRTESPSVASNHPSSGSAGSQVDDADRDQEIASDNAMLQAIHSEIYRPEPSPLAPYEQAGWGQGEDTSAGTHHPTQHRPSTPQVRD